MCYKMQCPKCSKWTWGGCGMHISQALAGIPPSELCRCKQGATKDTNNKESSSSSLFGRRNYSTLISHEHMNALSGAKTTANTSLLSAKRVPSNISLSRSGMLTLNNVSGRQHLRMLARKFRL